MAEGVANPTVGHEMALIPVVERKVAGSRIGYISEPMAVVGLWIRSVRLTVTV